MLFLVVVCFCYVCIRKQAEKLRLEVEKEQLILQAEKLQDKEVGGSSAAAVAY